MNEEFTWQMITMMLFFGTGLLLGCWLAPSHSKYGHGRNPYRRRCGECGQQQEFINYVGEPHSAGFWQANGEIIKPGCGCHDDCEDPHKAEREGYEQNQRGFFNEDGTARSETKIEHVSLDLADRVNPIPQPEPIVRGPDEFEKSYFHRKMILVSMYGFKYDPVSETAWLSNRKPPSVCTAKSERHAVDKLWTNRKPQ